MPYSRRDMLTLMGAAGALTLAPGRSAAQGPTPATIDLGAVVARNDAHVERLLREQVTDPASPHRGSVPDRDGLHMPHSAGGVAETLTASFVHPRSTFYRETGLLDRIRLAAGYLERSQSPQGNIDLPISNFNSPPDTGFVVHNVATAAAIGRRHEAADITRIFEPFLRRAGAGLAAGGVHTPNHRWVVCSALAQIHELFPDARLVRRVDEWLAEGIDIDEDGQFTERSTLTYNVVVDRALLVTSIKLQRPELLEPVRRNLRSLLYLLHEDGEVVTEISRRQDQYTRGNTDGYWFPLTWLAIHDRDGQFATLARRSAGGARLSQLLEYPEVLRPVPDNEPLPTDFERTFPAIGIARIRRGPLSATLVLEGSSRILTFRYGDAVMEGIRFASAFFGKAQFIPDTCEKRGDAYFLRQTLEAPYYQPLAQRITPETWADTRPTRRRTEVCRLEQSAEVTERPDGFDVRLKSSGTDGVPLAVEIAFANGGTLLGCRALEDSRYLLESGIGTFRAGRNEIRFGPGVGAHRYVQVRGAEPKLPGQSVYLTGYTPFEVVVRFELR